MELEELKTVWASFDKRLENQELLKSAILRETLKSKSDTALGRMINYGYFGLASVVLVLAASFYVEFFVRRPFNLGFEIILGFAFVILGYGLYQGIKLLCTLHQIDFSKSVADNLTKVHKYCRLYMQQLKILLPAIGLLITGCVINYLLTYKIEAWRLVAIAGALAGGTVWGVWEYKRMYRKNIDIISQSLEELKNLE